jgi:large subunit ribosomal protein L16
MKGIATRGNSLAFGDYGLVSLEGRHITNRQIEAARIALTRHIKRGGKVWIRVFPDVPFTKKPAETRMGKGKGTPEYWVAKVQKGTVLYELSGVAPDLAAEALQLAGSKLPVRTKFIMRRDLE